MNREEEIKRKAEKRVEDKIGFYIHLAAYVLVNSMLVILWWVNGGIGTFPWFIFPMIGWGIGLSAHFIGVFMSVKFKDEMVEKEIEKMKKSY